MRTLIGCTTATVMAVIAAHSAEAETARAELSNCLSEHIMVSATDFGPESIDRRKIEIRIENGTGTALGGVWVSYAIWADNRPQPIYKGSIRPAATIPGGLLPGETMVSNDHHFMSDREIEIARKARTLKLTLDVENAADAQMNGFLQHPKMGSWSEQITQESCKPIESPK